MTSEASLLPELNHRHKIVWTAGIATVLIVFIVLLANAYFQHAKRQDAFTTLLAQRDFVSTPFSLMDANDICRTEASIKLGDSLLRQYMDPLSTRFDDKEGHYLIVLDADIGTSEEWGQAKIYCTVDPDKYRVSYYKEVYEQKVSMLSRTMAALGGLFK